MSRGGSTCEVLSAGSSSVVVLGLDGDDEGFGPRRRVVESAIVAHRSQG